MVESLCQSGAEPLSHSVPQFPLDLEPNPIPLQQEGEDVSALAAPVPTEGDSLVAPSALLLGTGIACIADTGLPREAVLAIMGCPRLRR